MATSTVKPSKVMARLSGTLPISFNADEIKVRVPVYDSTLHTVGDVTLDDSQVIEVKGTERQIVARILHTAAVSVLRQSLGLDAAGTGASTPAKSATLPR